MELDAGLARSIVSITEITSTQGAQGALRAGRLVIRLPCQLRASLNKALLGASAEAQRRTRKWDAAHPREPQFLTLNRVPGQR
jgi:hypothetical protein